MGKLPMLKKVHPINASSSKSERGMPCTDERCNANFKSSSSATAITLNNQLLFVFFTFIVQRLILWITTSWFKTNKIFFSAIICSCIKNSKNIETNKQIKKQNPFKWEKTLWRHLAIYWYFHLFQIFSVFSESTLFTFFQCDFFNNNFCAFSSF